MLAAMVYTRLHWEKMKKLTVKRVANIFTNDLIKHQEELAAAYEKLRVMHLEQTNEQIRRVREEIQLERTNGKTMTKKRRQEHDDIDQFLEGFLARTNSYYYE